MKRDQITSQPASQPENYSIGFCNLELTLVSGWRSVRRPDAGDPPRDSASTGWTSWRPSKNTKGEDNEAREEWDRVPVPLALPSGTPAGPRRRRSSARSRRRRGPSRRSNTKTDGHIVQSKMVASAYLLCPPSGRTSPRTATGRPRCGSSCSAPRWS